jgi:hypothetical protein
MKLCLISYCTNTSEVRVTPEAAPLLRELSVNIAGLWLYGGDSTRSLECF